MVFPNKRLQKKKSIIIVYVYLQYFFVVVVFYLKMLLPVTHKETETNRDQPCCVIVLNIEYHTLSLMIGSVHPGTH